MALQDPVAIYTASSNAHGEEVRLLLAHCGVESYVTEATSVIGELWTGQPGVGIPSTIWVNRSDAGRATELIDEYESLRAARAAEGAEEGDLPEPAEGDCLACGWTIPEESDHCPACGWTYGAGSGGA